MSLEKYYHACSILGFCKEITDQVGRGLRSHLFSANFHQEEMPQRAAQNPFDPSGKSRIESVRRNDVTTWSMHPHR